MLLPSLNQQAHASKVGPQFVKALREEGFKGDLSTKWSDRVAVGTDNSIYQNIPQAVIWPRSAKEVQTILTLAQKEPFETLTFTARGGGTGTHGQALTEGIVIDMSRYMINLIDLNLSQGWVEVEPGITLFELNQVLKKEGVFFAPHVSPADRATIGGMIGTDACGKGSLRYGRTKDHLLSCDIVLANGTQLTIKPVDLDRLKETNKVLENLIDQVIPLIQEDKEKIESMFPDQIRYLTGLNLKHVINQKTKMINLLSLIAGAEGTLGLITKARLKITKRPTYKQGLITRHATRFEAIKAGVNLLKYHPTTIESMDDTLVNLALNDPYLTLKKEGFVKENDHLNIIEITEDQEGLCHQKCQAIIKELEQSGVAYLKTKDEEHLDKYWNVRSSGVGTLVRTKSTKKAIPMIEDTCVNPEYLADYCEDVDALLKKHDIASCMYGHIDVGCMHIRPFLDLKDETDQYLRQLIINQVHSLLKKYKGLMWAEHGPGYRCDQMPEYLPQEIITLIKKIKAIFDPLNRLNPGKIIPQKTNPGYRVKQETQENNPWDQVNRCNGNARCESVNPDLLICPSSKVTRNRIHSPKGRAMLFRQWLFQLNQEGVDLKDIKEASWLGKGVNTLKECWKPTDFSTEVKEAMSGCLSCKACESQCPAQISIPLIKSDFLNFYYTRYLRSIRDVLLKYMEKCLQLGRSYPWITYVALKIAPLFGPCIGLKYLPRPSGISLLRWRHQTEKIKHQHVDPKKTVVIIQDAFTSFFETELVKEAYDCLEALGLNVILHPFFEIGKPLQILGEKEAFMHASQKNQSIFEAYHKKGIPMVVLEPSISACLNENNQESIPKSWEVQNIETFLYEHLSENKTYQDEGYRSDQPSQFLFFEHCMTVAENKRFTWEHVFQLLNLPVKKVKAGCCGMAGFYGLQKQNQKESKALFENSWKSQITANSTVLASGFSCRQQLKVQASIKAKSPLSEIKKRLNHEMRSGVSKWRSKAK